MLLKASECEEIFEGNDEKYKAAGPFPSAQNLQRTSEVLHPIHLNMDGHEHPEAFTWNMNDTQYMVVCKEEDSTEQERRPSLVKEEPESPHIKEEPDGAMLLAVKSEDDDDEISSHCSEVEIEVELDSDTEVTEDSDEWEETSGVDASYSAVALNSHAKSQHPQTSRAQEQPLQRDEPSIFLLVGVVPASTNGVRSQSAQTQVFSCSECSYAFTSQVFLYRHMKRNHNDLYCQLLRNGQITSAACQQIISSVTTSQQKGDTDEPRSYGHQQFTKTLSQPGGVKTYTDSMNRTGKKPHICKHCGKGFPRLSNLKTHEHVHTGEKLFHCKQCDKSFSWSGDLNRHRLVHTRAKPFHCKHCDKSFNEAGCLKKHQRVHTGERPFHCTHCDKCFKLSGHLKSHQLIHTGERPFHCKLCDKSFGHSSGMSRHMRIHTGEKPFQCKHCDKRFIETGALKTHQRVHAAKKNLSTVNAVADCQ